MSEIDLLATALVAAQAEMPNAAYNKTNPHFKSKYADLAAIREATLPALNKHGLTIIQFTQIGSVWNEDTEKFFAGPFLHTRLIHKSGQFIESVYPLSMSGTPQQKGSERTYVRRYEWGSICGIASEDDDDANAAEGLPATNARGQGSGKSKANSRSDYEALAAEMRTLKSPAELNRWKRENVNRINGLPAEWIDILGTEYTDRLDEMKKTEQAANAARRSEGKPYGGVKEQLKASLEAAGDDDIKEYRI